MVNGISSYNSYTSYLQPQAMRNKPDPAEMFKKVDTDGSGGISQSELDALAEKISSDTGRTIDTGNAIATYDTDGNGELSSEEMDAFMKSTMQQGVGHMGMQGGPGGLFNALDTDGSGGVSQSELETWAQNMSEETGNTIDTTDAVTTYDTDGDGELSSTELKSFLDASGVPSPETAGMAPPHPPSRSSDSSETDSSSSSADGILSKYDTNGDGVLSATELQAYLDDQSSSINDLIAKALSAYTSNIGSSQSNSLQDLFMSLTGSSESYTPVDYTA
jgi:Ca2+-binding EF-hand superfamily protein